MSSDASASLSRYVLVPVALGLSFGLIIALAAGLGGEGSLSFWLENTGGPWFLAAFVSGYLARSGATAGAAAGFTAVVLALFVSGSLVFATDGSGWIQFSSLFEDEWLAAGALIGGVFGFLGGWATEDRWDRWLGGSVLGALLVGEAVALFLEGPLLPEFDPAMASVQIFAGTGVMLFGARGRPSWPAIGVFLAVSGTVIVLEFTTGLVTMLVSA